jgi:phosphatidylethanolamine N-methyltransferase
VMDAPVTTFPFTVSNAPMYHGSTLSFLATAIYRGKPAGLLLTALVAMAYEVARKWEDPFTGMIYEKRDREWGGSFADAMEKKMRGKGKVA